MAEAFVEPYDQYATINADGIGLGSYWPNTGGTNKYLVTGLSGVGQALQLTGTSTNTHYIHRAFPATKQVSWAFRFKFLAFPDSSNNHWLWFMDSGGASPHCSILIDTSGFVTVTGEGGAVLATSLTQLVEGAVHHFAIRIDVTTGGAHTMQIIKDGDTDNPFIDITGADLLDQAAASIYRVAKFITYEALFDSHHSCIYDDEICLYDEYVIIPELELRWLNPTADVTSDFTPSSGGNNYAMVDEDTIDSETTYNSSNTVGHKDLFDHENIGFTPDYIWGVTQFLTARKEESATQSLQMQIKSGATEVDNYEFFLSMTYTTAQITLREDPNTTDPWTLAAIDAIQSGYELVTGS